MFGLRAFHLRLLALVFLLSPARLACGDPPKLPTAAPEDVGMEASRLKEIEPLVQQAIAEGKMPGCVIGIGRHGRMVWLNAFGDRQVEPAKVPMSVNTVFDLASLTKPIATATCVMHLVESGRLRLRDRVVDHLMEFAPNGKDKITIQQLLTHQSGLLPDNALEDYQQGADAAWQRICELDLQAAPGERFIYSDVNFIVLAELIRCVSGQDLHAYSQQHVFGPLGMRDTGFVPGEELRARAAPTEQRDGTWLQGVVHDPRAHLLGGIAGHAGLFSTAEDLAVFAQMMLDDGSYGGVRVLAPASVRRLTAELPVPGGLRGLGWDKQSAFSSNRGELFSRSAFGHGGFTGTVIWMDPELDLFVIFLSSRLHPDGEGSVNPLAGRIGAIAAAAIREIGSEQETASPVLSGIDVLRRDEFRALRGRRIGLITNQTGIAADGTPTVQLLHQAPGVQLLTLFSPEHGFQGTLDVARIDDAVDPATGLRVYSLYGETRKPTSEMLRNLDTVVFDIQDIGARFYTYVSTMGLAMEAAGENGVRFVVLDRPNPINGMDVDGPVLDGGRESFVGFHPLAVRHGMTMGELARMLRAERQWDVELEVIPVEGWDRGAYFDACGLPWVNPSPNMRTLDAALLYPGIGLLETTNVSVGRGTDTPFEILGAPWIEPISFARELNQAGLAGVRFLPLWFTPNDSKFKNERCGGVRIHIVQRSACQPLAIGFTIARTLRQRYQDVWEVDAYDRLLGDAAILNALKAGSTTEQLRELYQDELHEFLQRREEFLMY